MEQSVGNIRVRKVVHSTGEEFKFNRSWINRMIRYGGNKILNLREVIWSNFRIVITYIYIYLKTLLDGVSTRE